ncbi:MAG: hypothetical protein CMF55_00495 [Legionellales bacterium]|nr:hypothetical protein [Legionellales bacterium]|tara:strand:+ start:2308 stop:2664 length:357 start_codon:yes stop_codon:yes gene_type:complete
MEICEHAYDMMEARLTDDEKALIEARTAVAWERRDTLSLATVAHELKGHRLTDNAGVESNGNLVITIVRGGTMITAFLRRDTQEISKTQFDTKSMAWAIPKRATGPKARKHRRFTNRR